MLEPCKWPGFSDSENDLDVSDSESDLDVSDSESDLDVSDSESDLDVSASENGLDDENGSWGPNDAVKGVIDRPISYGPASEDADMRGAREGLMRADYEDNEQAPSSHDRPGGRIAKAPLSVKGNIPETNLSSRRRPRKRLGLPLTIVTHTREESIVACPDSGSDDNIMSQEIAEKLNLPITEVEYPSPSTFVLANGRTVSAVGQVRLKCAFERGSSTNALIECVFYVFQTLAVPMIMGIQFLHATETLTKHRDRLVEELVPSMQALRVCCVGRPKRNVVCRVGNYIGCATADTGSELDLVSPDFAASRAFNVEDLCVEVEFADGSKGYTMGVIKTAFSIGRVSDIRGFIPRTEEILLELFILNNLNADILVGTDTIQGLQAFSSHEDCFIPAMPRLGQSDLNIIRYIGAVERGFSKAWEFVKDSFTSSGKKQAETTNQHHKRKQLEQHDQLLQDQLDNRKRLQFIGTVPREGLPRTELPLQSSNEPNANKSSAPQHILDLEAYLDKQLQESKRKLKWTTI